MSDDPWGNTDEGGFFAAAFAKLSLSLNGVTDAIKANQDRPTPIPVDLRKFASVAANAAGVAYLDLGAPDQGTRWLIRHISVGGVTYDTTVIGRCDVYVAATKPVVSNLPDLQDSTGIGDTLPAIAFYGARDLTVMTSEHLWLVVVGGGPGVLYSAGVSVEQYTEGSYSKAFSL